MNIDDLNLDLFEWKNGTKIQNAVLTSDGTTVQDAVWEGETPISASNLKKAQNMLALAIMQQVGLLSDLTTENKNSLVAAINEVNNPTNNILWSGEYFMKASQTITLSQSVSKQKNGIVLVWVNYENEAAQNNGVNCFFIPKSYVQNHSGKGHGQLLIHGWDGNIGKKYVYITDTKVSGFDGNEQAITQNGIVFHNDEYVLRYVIGV